MALIAALFFSISGLKSEDSSAQKEELMKEIVALREETETLRLQSALRQQPIIAPVSTYQAPPVATTTPTPPAADKEDDTSEALAELQRQLAEQEEENEALVKEKEKAERKQGVAEQEASMAWKERTKAQQKMERERKRVEIAMKMGTIMAVNVEYGFVVFQPARGQQFQSGQTLGIRRNSGILGQIVVRQEENGDYIADLKANAYAGGYPAAQEGDEIIILPATYRAPGETDGTPIGNPSTNRTGSNGIPKLRELLPTLPGE